MVTGALGSLTALGLVLIYRSSRIVNFAQAEVGGIAAALAVTLVADEGVNYFAAIIAALVLSLMIGAITELVIVRRFRNSPRLILTVATIGLAQVLGAGTLLIPQIFQVKQTTAQSLTFSTPFNIQFQIAPILFNGNHLVAVVAIVGVLIGMLWLFNRTDTGIGIRAAADSLDRARLLGMPVRRLSLVTWIVAAGLSGLAGILSAGVTGYTTNSIAGPEALLAPLAAAVLARFESLWVAVAASVAIGVFTQGIDWSFPQASWIDVALFGVILVALLLQRRRSVRVVGEELGSFVASRQARVVPKILRRLPEVRATRAGFGLAAVAVFIILPFLFSQSSVVLFGFMAIYAIVGVSLVVLTGWSGQVSLGQFGFVGLGAGVTGSLLVNANLNFFLCLLIAVVVGALSALVIGIPALRLPGLFLAPITLAFAVAMSDYFLNPDNFPQLTPLSITPPILFNRFDLSQPTDFYYFCLIILAVVMVLAWNFRRSRIGRAVLAVRDNERMAAGFSISPTRAKLVAFAVSGAMAGLAGGLYGIAIRGISFNAFSSDLSVQVFTLVVVGGLTSLSGAIFGAIFLYLSQYLLHGPAQLFSTGFGLLFILMQAPGGLAEFYGRAWHSVLGRITRRRGRRRARLWQRATAPTVDSAVRTTA